MKYENTPPEHFTDREELRLALRETVVSGDTQRGAALQKRADILRDKWREEHAEEIARADDEILGRIVKGDPEATEYITRKERERLKAIAQAKEVKQRAEAEKMQIAVDAETQRQRAERAEAGQTPRGVPFDKTTLRDKPDGHEFTPSDFCEALKREKGHEAAIRRALDSWGKGSKRGSRWALTRSEAETFWQWHNRAKHKAHPPRARNKIARK